MIRAEKAKRKGPGPQDPQLGRRAAPPSLPPLTAFPTNPGAKKALAPQPCNDMRAQTRGDQRSFC